MGLKKLFLITVLAGAMSVLGCGDDETGGTGNTGGDGATGGAGATGGGGGTGGQSASELCAACENQGEDDIALCEAFYNDCENTEDVCRLGALALCEIV